MRFSDLRQIEKLLLILEYDQTPDKKTLEAVREVVDRERKILRGRAERSYHRFNDWKLMG